MEWTVSMAELVGETKMKKIVKAIDGSEDSKKQGEAGDVKEEVVWCVGKYGKWGGN